MWVAILSVLLIPECLSVTIRPLDTYNWLSMFHQSDIHSHYEPVTSNNYVCSKKISSENTTCFGGFARAVAYIKHELDRGHRLLNVNSGDFFQGHIYYTLFGWQMAADIVSKMPYHALALGNQEFHDGLEALVPFMRQIGPKFVCTNLNFTMLNTSLQDELSKLCPPHRLVEIRETFSWRMMNVAILSYTTPETGMTFEFAQPGDVIFEDEVMALHREIALIQIKYMHNKDMYGEGIHVFVALGHSGLERDKEVAYQVPSLDIIVGSHSHTLLWPGVWQPYVPDIPEDPTDHAQGVYPVVVTQESGRTVLVLHASKLGKYMGGIDVGLNDEGEVRDWWPTIFLLKSSMPRDPEVVKLLEQYNKKLYGKRSEVIGQSLVGLEGTPNPCFQSECNLGNMFADAILWANNRDDLQSSRDVNIALVNSGVIMHGNLPASNITLDMLLRTLPFQDTITIVSMTGETLLEALEHSVSEEQSSRFLQVSGVKVKYNIGLPVHHRVVSAQVLCTNCSVLRYSPVEPNLTYDVAMLTYMADGGDSYDMVRDEAKSRRSKNMLDVDIMLQFFKVFVKVYPRFEDRITVVNESPIAETSSARERLLDLSVVAVCAVLVTYYCKCAWAQ